MPTVEVDELEYAQLQRVAGLATKLGQNPKTRGELQKLVAIVAPEEAGAEVHLRTEFSEQFNSLNTKLDEFLTAQKAEKEEAEAKRAERRLAERWSAGKRAMREQGWSDDGIEKLEAFMEEKGIPDHELAAPAFEKLNPQPQPVETGGSAWNFFDQRDDPESGLEMLLKGDSEGFLRKQTAAALNEVRGQR